MQQNWQKDKDAKAKGNFKGDVYVDISESLLKDPAFRSLFFDMFSKHVPQSKEAMINFVQEDTPQI